MINDWLAMAEEEGGERERERRNNAPASDRVADGRSVVQKSKRGFVKEWEREVMIERDVEGWIEMKGIDTQKGVKQKGVGLILA